MKPILALAAALIALAAAPARADTEYCNDYWFVRNQVFDHAGYCFSSRLGKALFNNADCFTTDPALSARDRALVARIKGIEARLGCNVNTNATSLPIPLLGMRLALEDIVARDEHSGFGCFGWRGPMVPLHSAHHPNARELYTIRPGDDLLFLYDTSGAPEAWDFVEVERGGRPVGLGWFALIFEPAYCTDMAG